MVISIYKSDIPSLYYLSMFLYILGFSQVATADDRNNRSRKSSIATRDFDDVIFNPCAIRTATPGLSSTKTYCKYSMYFLLTV